MPPNQPTHADRETLDRIEEARLVSGTPYDPSKLPASDFGALLAARAAERPSSPYLITYDARGIRREFSYESFADQVGRVAAYLEDKLGIRCGDRVATLLVNDSDTVIVTFAFFSIGATAVPINVGEDDERVSYILENSGARLLAARPEQLDRARRVSSGIASVEALVQVGGDASPPGVIEILSEARKLAPRLLPKEPPGPEQEALIIYTSGTTGPPKGVVLTQANLLLDSVGIAAWHGLAAPQKMMCVLPIHHVNGLVVTLITPLVFGGSTVLNYRFQTRTFWKRLAEERVNVVSVVPTLLAFLLEEDEDISRLDLGGFRHFICGAGPLSLDLAARFEDRFGMRIVHGYGLSETTCYSCFLPIDLSAESHRGWMRDHGFPSIGVPIPQNEMAIHDPSGRPVPPGERGEIVIRGHNVMKYYFQRPDANRDTFLHRWFRSGDEGFYMRDEENREFFFITGRLKELIIRGGINISPFEIDEVLNRIPGVQCGLAVAFDNKWYGEEVGAYVKLEPDAETDAETILRICREKFPFNKSPKVVVFGDDIPVTSTGKYQRNRLKPLFKEHSETQFRKS